MEYHKDKEANLIAKKLLRQFNDDTRVQGIFLSGSSAYGGNDRSSDIDINVVVENPEEYLMEIDKLVAETSTITFSFTPPFLSHIRVYYLNDQFKLDIGVYSKDSVGEQIAAKTKIIKDTNKTIEKYIVETAEPSFLKVKAKQYLGLAVADLIAVDRELRRGDLYEARFNLDDARYSIGIYLNLINGNKYFSYNKFREFISEEVADRFEKSLLDNHTLDGIRKAAQKILEILVELKVLEKESLDLVKSRIEQ